MLIENYLHNASITTDSELDKAGYKFCRNFKGVYASDQIPSLKNNESCIINTDPSHKSGVHWCALYCHNNHIYFYDSYKRPYYTLSKFWKSKKWIQPQMNETEDQSEYAMNCGQLCIAAINVFDKYGPLSWEII